MSGPPLGYTPRLRYRPLLRPDSAEPLGAALSPTLLCAYTGVEILLIIGLGYVLTWRGFITDKFLPQASCQHAHSAQSRAEQSRAEHQDRPCAARGGGGGKLCCTCDGRGPLPRLWRTQINAFLIYVSFPALNLSSIGINLNLRDGEGWKALAAYILWVTIIQVGCGQASTSSLARELQGS